MVNSYDSVIQEHFDIQDHNTRRTLLSIDEADQTKVLESLTGKLYESIMEKVDDIDFGSIPETKGDITKVENYDKLLECINVIKEILISYKQNTDPVDNILLAIKNVSDRKDLFSKAYAFNLVLPILLYQTVTLSIVSSVSLIIATSIEFVKDAGADNYSIKFDKVAYAKSKDNMLYQNLVKFNKCCSNGDIDRCLDQIFTVNSKHLLGLDALGIVSIFATIGIITNIIPIMRELVFFFYNTRQSMSDYFTIQAELLQVNAELVRNNNVSTTSTKDRREIARKQQAISDFFKKIGNALSVDVKTSEAKAKKQVAENKKLYKIDDIDVDKLESLDSGTSSIF